MHVLNDSVLRAKFRKSEIENQLDQIKEIVGEIFIHRKKCKRLLAIIDGKSQGEIHDLQRDLR